MRRYSSKELHAVRNQIPITRLICDILTIPHKVIEGIFRFLCPVCGEFQTAVNAETNLCRCFRCERNFNTIELVMEDRATTFVESVKLLRKHFAA